MTQKTQKIVPIGRIFTNTRDYYLINPQPLPVDWEAKGIEYRFLVVPFQGDDIDWIIIDNQYERKYPCPREVVFSCELQVEYTTDIRAINCELPFDVTDLVTTEIE